MIILSSLLAVLFTLSFFQRTKSGFMVSFIYSTLTIFYTYIIVNEVLFPLDARTGILSGAITDSIIISIIVFISRKSFLTQLLIIISIMSIACNGMAYALWELKIFPEFNEYSHLVLYSLSIIAMIINLDGRVKNSWIYTGIFSPAHKRNFSIQNLDSKKTL